MSSIDTVDCLQEVQTKLYKMQLCDVASAYSICFLALMSASCESALLATRYGSCTDFEALDLGRGLRLAGRVIYRPAVGMSTWGI